MEDKAPAIVAAAAAPDERVTEFRGQDVKSPSDFLKGVLGRSVIVKLNSGVDYRGQSP